MQVLTVLCPYCGGDAVFMTSSRHVYKQDYGPIYDCRACDAYVGAHPDGSPKGTPANRVLRAARRACHEAFDPLWQSGSMTRSDAYKWLASAMGVSWRKAHVGHFDLEQCKKMLSLVRQRQGFGVPDEDNGDDDWGPMG